MQEIIVEEPSVNHKRIFEELLAWEQEFSSKENILREKSQDLRRSLITNQILQSSLEESLQVIDELNSKVHEAATQAYELKSRSIAEKHICDSVVGKLTKKLDDMKRKYQEDVDQYDQMLHTKTDELKRGHHDFVKDLTEKHKQELIAMKIRMENENKGREDGLLEENEMLKKRIEILINETITKGTHEAILNERLNEIKDLKSQVHFLKSQYQAHNSEFSRLKKENDSMNFMVKKYREKMERVQLKVDEYQTTIADLQQYIQHNSMRYQQAINQCQSLQTTREELQREILNLKNRDFSDSCGGDYRDHQVEALIKQNAILKALVKEMRKERIGNNNKKEGKLDGELNETEQRVEKLEFLIRDLRKVFLERCTRK